MAEPVQPPAVPAANPESKAAAAVQPPAAPPVAPPVVPAPKSDDNPTWLPERLNQAKAAERRAVFEKFGVENETQLADKLKKLEELEVAQLTEAEKKDKRIKELEKIAKDSEGVQKRFNEMIEAQFNQLPEEQRAAIEKRAGEDWAKRWELMQLVSELGTSGTPAAPPAAPAAPKPASTPTGPPAPKPGGAPKNAWEQFQDLQAQGPASSIRASLFYSQNRRAIEIARDSATTE